MDRQWRRSETTLIVPYQCLMQILYICDANCPLLHLDPSDADPQAGNEKDNGLPEGFDGVFSVPPSGRMPRGTSRSTIG